MKPGNRSILIGIASAVALLAMLAWLSVDRGLFSGLWSHHATQDSRDADSDMRARFGHGRDGNPADSIALGHVGPPTIRLPAAGTPPTGGSPDPGLALGHVGGPIIRLPDSGLDLARKPANTKDAGNSQNNDIALGTVSSQVVRPSGTDLAMPNKGPAAYRYKRAPNRRLTGANRFAGAAWGRGCRAVRAGDDDRCPGPPLGGLG